MPAVALNRAAAFSFHDASRFSEQGVLMPGLKTHPTTRLIVWLFMLVVVQFLNGLVLAAAFLLLPLLGVRVLKRGARLIWRTRWLLISLFVIFSWGVAGEPLWNSDFAPTQEGVLEALVHLGRMLLVLMAVATFLELMPLPDLLVATHVFLKPWKYFGFDPDRGVVRLMLVLRYVESLPRPQDWRKLLDAPVTTEIEWVELNQQQLGRTDYLVGILLVIAAMFYVFA